MWRENGIHILNPHLRNHREKILDALIPDRNASDRCVPPMNENIRSRKIQALKFRLGTIEGIRVVDLDREMKVAVRI
tara:strand:+ start:1966 stop:2196 length:231 start_codon:yes stop_codon:yes gene_type:complete